MPLPVRHVYTYIHGSALTEGRSGCLAGGPGALGATAPPRVHTQTETAELVSGAQATCAARGGSLLFLQALLRAPETAAG